MTIRSVQMIVKCKNSFEISIQETSMMPRYNFSVYGEKTNRLFNLGLIQDIKEPVFFLNKKIYNK